MSYPMIEIGELMLKRNGSVDPSKFVDETFELHSIPAFDRGFPDIVKGSEIGSSKQLVQENDVMISKIVPHIRRASVVCKKGNFRQIASGEWIVFRSNKIYPDYLKHVLISDNFNKQFMATVSGVGGSLLRARPAFVSKIKIALPPLEEQRRIASILDKANELRQKRQEAIEKLDQLLQATFIDMFGDPVSNPKNWETTSIDKICSNIVDCVNKTAPVVEYETPYKMIRTTNVRNYKVDLSSVRYVEKETFDKWNRRLTPQRGDVILTREAPVGEVGILESDDSVFLGQRLMLYRINLEFTTPEYLLYFLMSDSFKIQYEQMSSGSTVKHLSVPQCSKWNILVPPIELQLKFSQFYKMIHSNSKLMHISFDKADTLFKSLQNQAFSGNL